MSRRHRAAAPLLSDPAVAELTRSAAQALQEALDRRDNGGVTGHTA